MGKKVLVADDSVTIQKVIKLALSSEGYDIQAVSDGKSAIRSIVASPPDIVLIDIALPGADAFEVKRAIEATGGNYNPGYVLLASAFERLDEQAIEKAGFQGRLIKPFDPANLRKVVSDFLKSAPSAPIANAAPTVAALDPIGVATSVEPPASTLVPPAVAEPMANASAPYRFPIEKTSDVAWTNSPEIVLSPPESEPETERTVLIQTVRREESRSEDSQAVEKALENDIKNLTESTIKMSGLDEMNWSLDDSRKMKAPPPTGKTSQAPAKPHSTPPAPPKRPAAQVVIQSAPTPGATPSDVLSRRSAYSDAQASFGEPATPPQNIIDDGGSTFPIRETQTGSIHKPPANVASGAKGPAASKFNFDSAREDYFIDPPSNAAVVDSAPVIELTTEAPVSHIPITRAEIEALIRRDVEAAILKLARDEVPAIAEKLIRNEIEKILNEA